jgi:hypothetical protein
MDTRTPAEIAADNAAGRQLTPAEIAAGQHRNLTAAEVAAGRRDGSLQNLNPAELAATEAHVPFSASVTTANLTGKTPAEIAAQEPRVDGIAGLETRTDGKTPSQAAAESDLRSASDRVHMVPAVDAVKRDYAAADLAAAKVKAANIVDTAERAAEPAFRPTPVAASEVHPTRFGADEPKK